MVIVWDELKRKSNIDKHGFDFAGLDVSFFRNATLTAAKLGRFKAVDIFNDEEIVVIFALRGTEAISIISMRPANKKERIYNAN
jgi:uncharacterized protein